MKKILIILLSITLIVSSALLIAGCNTAVKVEFTEDEYEIYDGVSVAIKEGKATFELITMVDGVGIDENSGKFSVASTVPDCTQVIVVAKVKDKVAASAVCMLRTATVAPTVRFTNLSQYVVNGDAVNAVSTPLYAVSYSLKQDYPGISVNSVTGKVTFSKSVADGASFTVVATAKEETTEKTFFVAKGNYVLAETASHIAEYKVGSDVTFYLDYQDNPEARQAGVLAVMRGHNVLDKSAWSYDSDTQALTLSQSFIGQMSMGDNILKVITAKNAVSVTVQVVTYVATAKELAAINDSQEALSGSYIMVCDIDLTDYLGLEGDGYNNGRGWNPIGVYYDVNDGTATDWAFKGTFDGNGHTISGFFMDRADDLAYNSGFFGYIDSQGVVKNLGLQNAEGKVNNVRSYSGGFAGVNVGRISDCWANVSVITGEAFKVVGGFVGRNEGVIENCFSLGKVSGGENVGSFAGVSQTDTSRGTAVNCYAIQTDNYPFSDVFDDNCKTVKDINELLNCDFSSYSNWNVAAGRLPTLSSIELKYDLREIKILNTSKFYSRGDTFRLNVITNPSYKATELGLNYEIIEGRGVSVSADGSVNTRQMNPETHHCVIKITCGDMSALYQFDLYENVRTVEFAPEMESVMYAGNYYKVDTAVTPADANQYVELRLTKNLRGVTLNDGVITVSSYVDDGEIEIEARAVNGATVRKTVTIVANRTFDDNYKLIYREDKAPVSFVLPQGVAGKIVKVTRFDKAVPYTVNGDSVTVDSKYFSDFGSREVPVKFITEDGIYAATVAVYDKSNVVEIGSVQEFMDYKNNFKTDESLRSKTVVLTADLDFENATITSIGSHHLGMDFKGIFNGNGFTIKNLNIDRNDFEGEYIGEEDGLKKGDYDVYPFHASRFNVGLFSFVTGTVSNVNFENVTVASYFTGTYDNKGNIIDYQKEPIGNFVGIVAGTVNGTVSNCTFTNCVVKASGDIKGVVCGKQDAALIVNCRIDGELYEK